MNSQVYKNSIKNVIKVLNLFLLITGTLLPLIRFIALKDKNILIYAKDVIFIVGFSQTTLRTVLFFLYKNNLIKLYNWAKLLYTTKYNEDIKEIAFESLNAHAKFMRWIIKYVEIN